jgi:hypothetical protein
MKAIHFSRSRAKKQRATEIQGQMEITCLLTMISLNRVFKETSRGGEGMRITEYKIETEPIPTLFIHGPEATAWLEIMVTVPARTGYERVSEHWHGATYSTCLSRL